MINFPHVRSVTPGPDPRTTRRRQGPRCLDLNPEHLVQEVPVLSHDHGEQIPMDLSGDREVKLIGQRLIGHFPHLVTCPRRDRANTL